MVRSIGQVMKAQVSDPPKKWEDMNTIEKSIELYMGEKDLLFWLNVYAYASIFIVNLLLIEVGHSSFEQNLITVLRYYFLCSHFKIQSYGYLT